MPSPSRPSVYPDWCLTGTRSNPGGPAINTGWVPDEIPPAEFHNWLFGFTGDWIRWLDFITQLNAAQNIYDAFVGSGLSGPFTFPDINSLMTYMTANPGTIWRILVLGPLTITATQVINNPRCEFDFKASAVWSKGLSATPGISIQADGITIRGAGRFTSWSGVSDVAIQIESGHKNCLIVNQRFNSCTIPINDLGSNNTLANNIVET